MKRNMVLTLTTALLALVLAVGAVSASEGAKTPDAAAGREVLAPLLAELPGRITAAIADDRLVSVSMAVVLERDVIFLDAFGRADLERQRPATTRTIYPMGSVTKVFTATALARLWQEGVVGLEDPVQKYVPEYQPCSPFPGTLPTTLRQLATHTSGLPQDAPVNFWTDFTGFLWLVTGGQAPMTFYAHRDSLLDGLGDIELVYPPEVHAHYSNLNMQILGIALERACGRPFTAYVEEEILAPLGMDDTGFRLDADQRERLATGYVCTGPAAEPLVAPEYDLGCAVYSGGLFTTAEDLARFVSSQWTGDHGAENPILEQGALRRMRTPQSIHRPATHTTYGLGWGVVRIGEHDAIEHNGALLGYHAHVSAVPDLRLGIVALSNTKNFLWRPDACKELARSILEDLADALVAASASEGEPDAAAVGLGVFQGRYGLPGDAAHLEVRVTEDQLTVTLVEVSDFSEAFTRVDPYTFCFATDPERVPMLFFEPSAEGEIASVTFLGHRFNRMAQE